MMSNATEDTAPKPARTPVRPVVLAITAAFGLFYAFAVWAAIGNSVRYATQAYASIDQPAPVWLFIITILVPVIVFGLAFVFGRRRTVLELSVALFAGFAVVCAVSLSLTALNALIFTDLVLSLR